MSAHYDSYDYPSYWVGREYEHGCEIIAVKAFLQKIPKIKTILEIGAGFGRLTSSYIYRGKKIILSDPSSKLLAIARQTFPAKNVRIVHSGLETLPQKLRNASADLVILIRVLHHIKDIDCALKIINKLLVNNGYFILEFPNKKHFKATFFEFIKGNFIYPMELDTLDKRSRKNVKKNTIPFLNFHPDVVIEKLKENGFTIIEKRSVSNIRGSILTKIFPTNFLLSLSRFIQVPFGFINFGPSIFILAKKTNI
jgi:ubiquinone/menaquinone biosynthesis C-methylase UbiE